MVDSIELNLDDIKDVKNDIFNERGILRQQLDADVQNFLKAGGCVTQVEKDFRADPPKKPNMHYGTSPI